MTFGKTIFDNCLRLVRPLKCLIEEVPFLRTKLRPFFPVDPMRKMMNSMSGQVFLENIFISAVLPFNSQGSLQINSTLQIGIPSPPIFPTLLLNWISEIGRENIQLVLLVFLGIWLAYRLAANYAFYLFDLKEFKQAAQMVSGIVLPFHRRSIVIRQGEEDKSTDLASRSLFGGPISLHMDAKQGYAAVLEDAGGNIQILGPQDTFPFRPGRFMHLRMIVDLKSQNVLVSVESKTKDGIPVKVNDAVFVCQIHGAVLDRRKPSYMFCDKREVEFLVYNHWIGQDWENPVKRRKALRDLISTALKDFISHHSFMELLAELPDLANSVQEVDQNPKLLKKFSDEFRGNTGKHGLQLSWTGKGDWEFPPEFDLGRVLLNFPTAYEDWVRSRPEIQTHKSIEIQRREIKRLVSQVLKLAVNLRQSDQQDDVVVLELSQHYLAKIQNAIQLIKSRGDKVPKEWIAVEEYLKQIVAGD